MSSNRLTVVLAVLVTAIRAIRYDPSLVGYNLNENQTAAEPVDYWGEWDNHTYNPSPANWRFPFYVLTLDRYVDGDPTNDEANGTVFEHNWMTNQFRFGGDARGLQNNLDYIQGMGVRGIYLTGSPFINMPWSGDGYGPLDFTLLDKHHGVIEDWRALITEIHRRDMYIIFDNTVSTMGDLLAFEGYVNASAPFAFDEYDVIWKSDRRYHDFQPGNDHNDSCVYPRLWGQDGWPLTEDITSQFDGCKASEYDAYGDIKGTGAYPSYVDELSKFASVQDRLREWRNDVFDKIKVMSCMQIAMLDIDGFRIDKALQVTPDKMAEFSDYQRQCARQYGKENFLMVGEIVGDPALAAVFVGRGKQPDMYFNGSTRASGNNVTQALLAANVSVFIREDGNSALDGAAFHYDVYGAMTRFLGLDGPWGARGVDWVEQWTRMVSSNDMYNANTGEFDPRHMFGMTDQDVFRWPALDHGTERQLLGFFITLVELPGVPMVLFGEEQEYYVLENLAPDYVFGRMPMASARAWQLHGCYNLSEEVYVNMPFNSSGYGCSDDAVSLDHRDPSHPVRNVIKRMFELRRQFPTLNDGFNLLTLSSRLYNIYLPGSGGLPSPHGIWSIYRGRTPEVQEFAGIGQGNQGVWMIYQNENRTIHYTFDCASQNLSESLVSAFPTGTTVKNLFYPYEEYTLEASTFTYGIENSTEFNGCLPQLSLGPWDYKALVPKDQWLTPAPTITRVIPGHDARLQSTVAFGEQESVAIEIRFSSEMNCDSVTSGLTIASTTQDGHVARLNPSSVTCTNLTADAPRYFGEIPSAWSFRAELMNVSNGVHTYTISNATTPDGTRFTHAVDRFMFRIGQSDNPMVFPLTSNYTTDLLFKDTSTDQLYLSPRAAGADKFRYSLNWGSSFSSWRAYTGANVSLESQAWTGTRAQAWSGEHVVVHYWSEMTGSIDHVQHSDLDRGNLPQRRWPHVFLQGSWNQYGYDSGLPNEMNLADDGLWTFDLEAEWPTELIVNIWGMNPDGIPDKSAAFGDVDGDLVLDWVPPDSLAKNVINIADVPLKGNTGFQVLVNDGNYSYKLVSVGSAWVQVVLAVLLALIPLMTGALGIWAFMRSFYGVKFNQIGISEKNGLFDFVRPNWADRDRVRQNLSKIFHEKATAALVPSTTTSPRDSAGSTGALAVEVGSSSRRTVLIATMEYEIEDWNIKVKIGGLGVMSSLMGKSLGHQNLIWVVPCIRDIDYPVDRPAPPMEVVILGVVYEVSVQYHTVKNITYVLLDAPVFRAQTKAEPYPARMDDLDSAIYYSAWNQCIAQAITRFPVDLYHINDYHGTLAPLHLLPKVMPVCLSLHNAEFQGLWPLRTPLEVDEICRVYNLDQEIVEKYVQFGEVFNLLHAGASYLRIHQKGFGAVGVSAKYGKRAFARYPIFWGLTKIGALPNPDPTDTAEWRKSLNAKMENVVVDHEMEAGRGDLRRQAQEWAGLQVDPTAELFVFVGRWSQQKGVDLIADVFFSILDEHPKAQLICIGPVIDLYGKFAALKLAKMMDKYPGRVYSKPEFTALPPYIFSGAEFALIPSRDEPFGLVAVEFGRKGALGVGARVGGLGQMPGWWFTIESTTSQHLLHQFKQAIRDALATKTEERAVMRARSRLQRFPVVQWIESLEKLQSTSIHINLHQQLRAQARSLFRFGGGGGGSGTSTPILGTPTPGTVLNTAANTAPNSAPNSRPSTPPLLSREGPGHTLERGRRFFTRSQSNSRPSSPLPTRANRNTVDESIGGDVVTLPALTPVGSHDAEPTSLNQRVHETFSGRPQASRAESRAESFDVPQRPYSPNNMSGIGTPTVDETLLPQRRPQLNRSSRSLLSLNTVIGERKDFNLQKVDPFFTDSTVHYYKTFDKMLNSVDAKSSEDQLCIEKYLIKSEKQWFSRFHQAKLGMSGTTSAASSVFRMPWGRGDEEGSAQTSMEGSTGEEFLLADDYVAPTGLKKLLQKKVGDWQLYCFLLAFGQIIAANSYQITLLTGENGQSANKLFIIASIYLIASVVWWLVFRVFKPVYVLSLPFAFYGMAFLLIGMAPATHSFGGRGWIYNVATAMYAFASASGSFFFALNFGTEGGTPTQSWAYRACVIQGTQQIYVGLLWYWGSALTGQFTAGLTTASLVTSSKVVNGITVPVALLMWAVGLLIFFGLPKYYHQTPGKVPSFYTALIRRKTVPVFFFMVVVQNYWLSAPYGRNWKYLWSSQHAPAWAVGLLMIVFFILIWALMLYILGMLSKEHSWILPIFAIGLGAPRWAQMLWGTSNIGLYVPWGSRASGALLGRCLWLWLGVLDALQGVGFGMILLQTLTRFHVAFTLIAAQVIGSVATIAARASAPDRTGPGDVFPNFSLALGEGLAKGWFWIALFFQLSICIGFFMVFRKEQLRKP